MRTSIMTVVAMIATMLVCTAFAGAKTDLPGLPAEYKGDFYSGYIDIGAGKKLFYVFATSLSDNAATDPVTLWTNGGPGCSGFDGMMTELGPVRVQEDGTLAINKWSWNQNANVIFIEQPAGVGFSQAPAGMTYGDAEAAADNLAFIKGFFAEYSQYASNKFYLASESYGGHYLPTLAQALVEDGTVDTFQGFLVGNPLTYMPLRNYGEFATLNGHNLMPLPLWEEYEKNNCKEHDTSKCDDLEGQMEDLIQDLNPYALDFPICVDGDGKDNALHHQKLHSILKTYSNAGAKGSVGDYFPDSYEPCIEDYTTTYLNRADVQTALGVEGTVTWDLCNDAINQNYNMTDVNANVMPIYHFLINSGKNLDILIYSGDDDSVCATTGTQLAVWGLHNQGIALKEKWAPWKTGEGQVGGYLTQFAGFSLATVHGAGHMVPAARPEQAYELFTNYLAGKLTQN